MMTSAVTTDSFIGTFYAILFLYVPKLLTIIIASWDIETIPNQWWIQPDIHGGGGCRASESSPAGARAARCVSEVRGSAPIELRRGSGGAAPGKFLGDYTLKSAFLQ